jgi:hypothetical protein
MNKTGCRKSKTNRSGSRLVKFFFENRNDMCLMNRLTLKKSQNDLAANEVKYFFGTVNNKRKIIS